MESKARISAKQKTMQISGENEEETDVHVVFSWLSYDDFETKSKANHRTFFSFVSFRNPPIECLYFHLCFI